MAISGGDGSIILTTKVDESGINKGFSAIKSGASKVAKGFAVVGAAAATAFTAISTAAVNSYAEYEQLAGGVETLFKDSSNKLMGYADQAYKTAGMSANEYMSTVTSFSASLLQSLEGDTEKAADYANQAVIDMSDNANKMGTSIEMIQNAYQGFAKQNFTMLDNLKLGYGGTKEEMERLLADAEELSGLEFDISSFADITQAINIIQTDMGITGTTAKEASSTIQGSFASMKGAWQNLLTGMADENQNFDVLLENFINSIGTVMQNLLPRISVVLGGVLKLVKGLLPQIPSLLQQLLPVLINGTVGLINGLVQALPSIIQVIVDALPMIIDGIVQAFGAIVDALPSIIQSIVDALPTLIPKLIEGIITMVVTLFENFDYIIQPIIDALPDIIISLVQALVDNLPQLINGIIQLILGIVQAIPQIIQALVDALPTIIELIITSLLENLPLIIGGLVQVVAGIVIAIPQIFASMIEAIVNVFVGIWNSLKDVFGQLGTWIYNNVVAPILSFFDSIWKGIKSGVKKAINFVIGIINGLIGGFEGFVNIFVKGINLIIGGLNKISFDIPDWVPLIGGKKFGFNLPKMKEASFSRIPKLAQGAVIPPNREFMAILGDQKRGVNIETPLDTMIQAFKTALADGGYGGETSVNFTIELDGDTLYKGVKKAENRRAGINISNPAFAR